MKVYKLIIILFVALFAQPVLADDYFYKNDYGVILSEKEYNFISEMYGEGYQKYLTPDEYTLIKDMDLFDKAVAKVTMSFKVPSFTKGTSINENLRTLTITKSCSNNCYIVMNNKWNQTPNVKSYDVFGARIKNGTITKINKVTVLGNNYNKSYSNPSVYDNGFGYSILVPNVSNIEMTVSFVTTTSGTVYGSYQHTKKNTTEAISKQYTIGDNGYGNVFKFSSVAATYYDNSAGVDINL